MIKAIPTEYRGVTFRSRLEARWAVFFGNINIDVTYEPEGYVYDGSTYLPDFEIVETMDLVAIKPMHELRNMTDGMQLEFDWQIKMLENNMRLWIIAGVPAPGQYAVIHPAGDIDNDALNLLFDCRRCSGVCVKNERGDWSDLAGHTCGYHDRTPTESDRVHQAMRLAMRERFGERTNQHATRPERQE